jgi:rubrerythrin
VVGTIGAPPFRKFTAIGEAVNLASRIENESRKVESRFLIAGEVYARVNDQVIARPIPERALKGTRGTHTLFEVVGLRRGNGRSSDDELRPPSSQRGEAMRDMTRANLDAAFAGECRAQLKYAIFADQAEREGYPGVARLCRAISYAERVHATRFLQELAGIGDTANNLETALDAEHYETSELYPAFEAVARLQGEGGTGQIIQQALEAERLHETLYARAGEKVSAGQDVDDTPVFVCPVCGHTVTGEAPDECPICATPGDQFREF